jgi:hypothetical protein
MMALIEEVTQHPITPFMRYPPRGIVATTAWSIPACDEDGPVDIDWDAVAETARLFIWSCREMGLPLGTPMFVVDLEARLP